MTRHWEDIRWLFEADGSLRDIYIQDVNLLDWEKLIDFINLHYDITFGNTDAKQIDKVYVINYLKDETGEMECQSLRINLNGITIRCYFFLAQQIEFSFSPEEIRTINDFEYIESFMTAISQTLNTQVTLTKENTPECPLLKIDFNKNINEVLTIKELQELYKLNTTQSSIPAEIFESQALKSANEVYRPTSKDENWW